MSENYDAIIIGAGVIGACTAYEMAKAGWKTLSLDKGPEAGYGSTSASCAIIRTYYSAFETCALAYEGWYYWKDWANYIGVPDESGLITYYDTGCLVMKTEENGFLAKGCAIMDHIGCPYEHVAAEDVPNYMPGADLRQYVPAKRFEDEGFGEPTGPRVAGAVFFPCGGYVNDPKLSAHNAQRAAEAHGATFRFNTAVTGILRDGGRVGGVELSDGTTVKAPVVVNVAGPHSSIINQMAGVTSGMKMSTRALRHEVAHVPAPEGFEEGYRIVYSDSDIKTYMRTEQGRNLLVGSEDPECDGREWVDDPDNYDLNFSQQWKTMVMRAGQRLPKLGIPDTAKGVVALYDVSEDWMPIYDRSDLPGYYMACGTSGNQFKTAPVVGKPMTALIEACEAGRDHDTEPLTFHLDHVNQDISLGFFSRNREINMDSSFSVIG
ncbi:MAG: NAD(P)/FAD-dependent oxidoreductase [Paracoccaceae bacterium]